MNGSDENGDAADHHRRQGTDDLSAEERAEEFVQRAVGEGSRWLARVAGRVREEVEDIVAEGRELHERSSARSD